MDQIAYVASKHAVGAMTISAAREWAASGVRVNAIAPGAIRGGALSDVAASIQAATSPDQRDRRFRAQAPPLSRWSQPGEVAAVVLFLCSGEAKYITGACFGVDGGLRAL